MTSDEAFTLLWGLLPFAAAVVGLAFRLHAWRKRRDRRSMRELVFWIGLTFAAIASAVSLTTVVLELGSMDTRHVFGAIAYAAFGAALVIGVSEFGRDPK